MFKNGTWISGKYYWIQKYGDKFRVCQQNNEVSNNMKVVYTGSFISCATYLEELKMENPINPINRRKTV